MERLSDQSRNRLQITMRTTKAQVSPVRTAKIQTLTTPNAGETVEQQELSVTAGGNGKW